MTQYSKRLEAQIKWLEKGSQDTANLLLEARAKRDVELDAVIDALGIRDAYPDETKTSKRWESNYPNGYSQVEREYEYVVYGREAFVADITQAAAANRGSAAVDRLAKAIKAAR